MSHIVPEPVILEFTTVEVCGRQCLTCISQSFIALNGRAQSSQSLIAFNGRAQSSSSVPTENSIDMLFPSMLGQIGLVWVQTYDNISTSSPQRFTLIMKQWRRTCSSVWTCLGRLLIGSKGLFYMHHFSLVQDGSCHLYHLQWFGRVSIRTCCVLVLMWDASTKNCEELCNSYDPHILADLVRRRLQLNTAAMWYWQIFFVDEMKRGDLR